MGNPWLDLTSPDSHYYSKYYEQLSKRGLAEIISSKIYGGPYKDNILTSSWPNGLSMTYTLNSTGYREAEFSEGTDLVFSGCSFTFGTGLSEEHIWGNLLAKSLGMSKANLGQEGWSIQAIVKNLFSYFEEYGNPKILVCLFPDLQRMVAALNPHILRGHPKGDYRFDDEREIEKTFCHTHLNDYDLSTRPKYSKVPHSWGDVIPVEMPLMASFHYLHMLIQYCKAARIRFIWSTWDGDFSNLLDQVLKYPEPLMDMSGYVPLDRKIWDSDTLPKCHSEERSKNPETFDWALDHGSGHWGHNGQHSHIHTAEAFLEKLQ